jgi:hypothetical protein
VGGQLLLVLGLYISVACFWFIGPEHNVWPLLLLLFCFGLGHNKVVLIRLKNANEYEYATQMDRM